MKLFIADVSREFVNLVDVQGLFKTLRDMYHEDVMLMVQEMVIETASERDNLGNIDELDRELTIYTVEVILEYCGYSKEFADTIISMMNKHFLNTANVFEIVNLQVYPRLNSSDVQVNLIQTLSYYRGMFRNFNIPVEDIEELVHEDPRVGLSCVATKGDEVYCGVLRSIRSDGRCVVQDDDTGERVLIDMEDVRVWDKGALTGKVSQLVEGTYTPEVPPELKETAWHSFYGRVEIIDRTTDEYGHEMIMVSPLDILSFMSANKVRFSIKDDEIGSNKRVRDIRPVACYPSELFTVEDMGKHKNTIMDIMSGKLKLPEYHAFSSQKMTSPVFMRDRQNKVVKGFEKTETTAPLASTMDENVYIIADLPRQKITGSKSNLYHLEITNLIEKSIKQNTKDGKVDYSKVVFPKVETGRIEVTPKGDVIEVDGVTYYEADIVDHYDSLKVKKVIDGKVTWIEQYRMPMVLAMGVESGRLFITPAWWLHKVELPEEITIKVPKYVQKKQPKRYAKVYEILGCWEKIKDVEMTLNLKRIPGKVGLASYEEPRHKMYFDLIASKRMISHQYIDPATSVVVETPEEFVFDPEAGDPEYSPSADVITSNRPVRSSSEYNKEEYNKKLIAAIVEELKLIGVNSVKCELDPNGGIVKASNGTATWTINVIKKGKKYLTDEKLKMSKRASSLFSSLISAMHNKTSENLS